MGTDSEIGTVSGNVTAALLNTKVRQAWASMAPAGAGAGDVDIPVRRLDRFADGFQPCEMNDGLNLRSLAEASEKSRSRVAIPDVHVGSKTRAV